MKNVRAFLFLSIFIFFLGLPVKSFAYTPKEGNITASFGPYIYKTKHKDTDFGAKSPNRGSLGLLVNGDVSDKGALEIGMFHMNKIFFREQGPLVISEETQLMHITMGYRRFLSPLFSFSLAFYSSYTLGDYRLVHSDFPEGQGLDTSARDVTEYGVDFAFQYEAWAKGAYSAVVDLRYAMSVTNKPDEHSDHYGAFISLRYLVQEKQVENPGKKRNP